MTGPRSLSNQTELVKRHLALVFKHEIDPSAGPPEHQAELDAIHSATPVNLTVKNPPIKLGGTDPTTGLIYRC